MTLVEFKRSRFADIDTRTREILARGFTYNGVNVSLSTEALVRYEGMKDITVLLGTITVEASDDMNPPLVLATLLSIGPFVDAERAYVRSVYDAANSLKASIRNAADETAVEAIIDTRT